MYKAQIREFATLAMNADNPEWGKVYAILELASSVSVLAHKVERIINSLEELSQKPQGKLLNLVK